MRGPIAALVGLTLAGSAAAQPLDPRDLSCHDSGLFSGGIVTDICWDCLFPIRIAGLTIGGPSSRVPPNANTNLTCICSLAGGFPQLGMAMGFWEPARLIEVVRTPGCSPVLGGTVLPSFNPLQLGSHGPMPNRGDASAFYHYHVWAFPLLVMLELLPLSPCMDDAMVDLDLLYLSEYDPTWSNDLLALLVTPEAALFANPLAAAACAVDAASANAGRPLDDLFWCAGSWGNLYPLGGTVTGHTSMPAVTSLLATRAMAALHRRGLARRTVGSDAVCRSRIEPFLPKSQYRWSMLHPIPEATSNHVTGASTFLWGEWRNIPAVGEDAVHLLWRWQDCCLLF